MKIGLVDVDSKIPNLALMKLSAYHKAKGDTVEIYDPMFGKGYEKIYASKVFDFTPDFGYFPEGVEVARGGSGYDLTNKLPQEVEETYPDYDTFPCLVCEKQKVVGEFSVGFTTRGCIRKCKFCVVPRKEGKIHEVADVGDILHKQSHLKLLDNNLTAMPDKFERTCNQMIKAKVKVDFSQGLDIRLIDADKAKILSKVRLWKQIHFAFDNVKSERAVRKGIKILAQNGVAHHKLMFYVLIGFDSTPEEDLYRVELLRSLKVDPYVMSFDPHSSYQNKFERWVNNIRIFKTASWEDYR